MKNHRINALRVFTVLASLIAANTLLLTGMYIGRNDFVAFSFTGFGALLWVVTVFCCVVQLTREANYNKMQKISEIVDKAFDNFVEELKKTNTTKIPVRDESNPAQKVPVRVSNAKRAEYNARRRERYAARKPRPTK